ncbi:MAG: hypothetical protein RIT43_2322 [Bacteroidota bacterium]|jgi:hypothetical protein
MSINFEFEQSLKDPVVKFTIILGSGFHRNAIGGDSILSSWEKLLCKLSPGGNLTGQYHLDFEKIIQSKKIACEDSHVTEERLIACVQKLIKEEQERVLKECEQQSYPIGIFNPDKVSDVISLNFDEVPELLLSMKKRVKEGNYCNDSSFAKAKNPDKKVSKTSYTYLSTRHKKIQFDSGESIRFWHPHGEIEENKSIVLGLHRYSQMVNCARRVRNHHIQEKRKDTYDNTWYYRLLENPVLILGAAMSPTEWDMWFALTSRERANGEKQHIFQMRECECKKDVHHEWFQPLFTGMSFKEQWQELEKLFKTQ